MAQGDAAGRPQRVDRLILTSTGPDSYAPRWASVDHLAVAWVRLLPAQRVKRPCATGLGKVLAALAGDDVVWRGAPDPVLPSDLRRAAVISHFAVTAGLIRS